MKSTAIAILAVIFALSITLGGAYVIIDNLIYPQGNLFEGIVLTSLGTIIIIIMLIVSNIIKITEVFTNVYTKQLEIQKITTEFFQNSKPRTIGDILGDMKPVITITDLDTGETSSSSINSGDSLEKINEILKKAFDVKINETFNKNFNNSIKEKTDNREQLEKDLADAVKADDFEKATEIKEQLKKLNENNDNSEKKDD